jgi:simple sugar transport system substrate-binding protein/basic membrane protein A
LYNDIVDTALAGTFTGSKYDANYRVGFKDGTNPFKQSKFGSMVDAGTKALIATELTRISTTGSPFDGPVLAQDGTTMFAAGEKVDYATAESKNTMFVQGVVGEIPKG